MSTTKPETKALVEDQPEDCSPEEIVRELAFHLMVQRGLRGSLAMMLCAVTESVR